MERDNRPEEGPLENRLGFRKARSFAAGFSSTQLAEETARALTKMI
jgi:hypothetical protein